MKNFITFVNILYIFISNLPAFQLSPNDSTRLSNKGWTYFHYADDSTENQQEAFQNFKKALETGKNIREYKLVEYSFGRLATISVQDTLFSQALSYIDSAIVYSAKGEKNKSYRWLALKAFIYYTWKKYNAALKVLNLAEQEVRDKKDWDTLYNIYSERSRIFTNIDLLTLSEKTLEKMNQFIQEDDFNKKESIQRRLGDQFRTKGKYRKALEQYIKSLKLVEHAYKPADRLKIKSYTYNQMGECYNALSDYRKAEKYYIKAYLYADSAKSTYYSRIALLDLSDFYIKTKNLSAAKKYLSKLDSMVLSDLEIDLKVRKNKIYGKYYNTLGKNDSSLFYFKKALSFFEKQINTMGIERARSSFINGESKEFSYISNIYKNIINYDQNQSTLYDSLFKYSNIIRSRTLAEKKNKYQSSKDSLYLQSVKSLKKYQRDIRLATLIENDTPEIELNSLRYDLLNNKLNHTAGTITYINQISLNDFKTYLDQTNATAVIYNLNSIDQYALVINNSLTRIIDFNINPDTLSHMVDRFLKRAFYNTNKQFDTRAAHKLYQLLWKPVEDNFPLTQNIIIIPDKPVLSLPFDILTERTDQKELYGINEYPSYTADLLVNRYNFSILPSANLIKSLKPIPEIEQSLIVANPIFNREIKIDPHFLQKTGWSFEQLLYSKAEAKSVQKILDNAIFLEKEKATFKNILPLLQESSIVHFATHAFVDTVYDIFSGLVLSLDKDADDDGFLMGYEISNLTLNCDLVTLSACESGSGRLLNNEGVMGMPRLFFAAGARTTLMSIWKVNDQLSAELMPLFYKNLIRKGLSKTEALGIAKRYIVNKYSKPENKIYYSHPYFWATFNIYGDIKNNVYYSTSYFIYLVLGVIITAILILIISRKMLTK